MYAKGQQTRNPFYNTDVIYRGGVRVPGGVVVHAEHTAVPPPPSRLSNHLWDEFTFPDIGRAADAKLDCGAKGDRVTDDTKALQACLDKHGSVFLPPGLYRISATLDIRPGGSLVGMSNAASLLLAASSGLSPELAAENRT